MLHSFSMRNFCSFADPVEIRFEVGKHPPPTEQFFFAPSGTRLTKALALIGPNASGKTNLLKGLVFFHWFLLYSFRQMEAEQAVPIDPFGFTEEEDEPSCFCLEGEVAGELYRYELELNRERVLREILSKKYDSHYRYLFKRIWEPEEQDYDLRENDLDLRMSAVEPLIRENCSLFSVLCQIEHEPILQLRNAFMRATTNVRRWGRDDGYPDESLADRLLQTAEYFEQVPDLKAWAERILTSLDLGLSGLSIEEAEARRGDEVKQVFLPYGVHRVGDYKYKLGMPNESSGTQNLYLLLDKILPILKEGGIALVDEFEVDLHPAMIAPVLDLFFSPDTNPHNAQLIFSCHSVEVLRALDKTQVVLVEKDPETCRSEAWRLDTMKGVRRDDNLYAKYMSGVYGAVPDV